MKKNVKKDFKKVTKQKCRRGWDSNPRVQSTLD